MLRSSCLRRWVMWASTVVASFSSELKASDWFSNFSSSHSFSCFRILSSHSQNEGNPSASHSATLSSFSCISYSFPRYSIYAHWALSGNLLFNGVIRVNPLSRCLDVISLLLKTWGQFEYEFEHHLTIVQLGHQSVICLSVGLSCLASLHLPIWIN